MKILLSADLHIYAHTGDKQRIEDGLECLRWIYKTARDNNVKNVVFAGDLFHDRFTIYTYAFSKTRDIINENHDINTFLLAGNHDLYDEDHWDIDSISSLTNDHTSIINKVCTLPFGDHFVDFIPYTPTPTKYIKDFNKPSRVLVSHLAVIDAVLNSVYDIKSVEDDTKEKENIGVNAFSRWEKVFLGHYHYAQKLSNVEYLGSPMALSYGEANQKKTVAILDLENLHVDYVENTISPRFYILDDSSKVDSIDPKDSYIQFRTNKSMESKFDIRKDLLDRGARNVFFKPVPRDVSAQTVKALSNIADVINDKVKLIGGFVDGSDTSNLDKNVLKQFGMQIIAESKL